MSQYSTKATIAALLLSVTACDAPESGPAATDRSAAECEPEVLRVSIACIDSASYDVIDGATPDVNVSDDDHLPGGDLNDDFNEYDDHLSFNEITFRAGCETVEDGVVISNTDDIDLQDGIILVYDEAAELAADQQGPVFRSFVLPSLRQMFAIEAVTVIAGPGAGLIAFGITELSINGLLGKARDGAVDGLIAAVEAAYDEGIKAFNSSTLTKWSKSKKVTLVDPEGQFQGIDFEGEIKVEPHMAGSISAVKISGGKPEIKEASWSLDTNLELLGMVNVDVGEASNGQLLYEVGDSDWHYLDGPLKDIFPVGYRAWFEAKVKFHAKANVKGNLKAGFAGHVTVDANYDGSNFHFTARNGDINGQNPFRPVIELTNLEYPGGVTTPMVTGEVSISPNVIFNIGGEQFGFTSKAEATASITPKLLANGIEVDFDAVAEATGEVFAQFKDHARQHENVDERVEATMECTLTTGSASCTTPTISEQ